jgi:hypothetical protein
MQVLTAGCSKEMMRDASVRLSNREGRSPEVSRSSPDLPIVLPARPCLLSDLFTGFPVTSRHSRLILLTAFASSVLWLWRYLDVVAMFL